MRLLIFILLLAYVSSLTACSYITDFAVVNASDQPIEVRYKIRSYPGPFVPPVTPAVMTNHQLRAGNEQWRELSDAQYRLDSERRIITVRVMPDEVLRIQTVHRGGMQVNDAEEAEFFSIEEITIIGVNGEMKLQGEQARKSFVAHSRDIYILTYH